MGAQYTERKDGAVQVSRRAGRGRRGVCTSTLLSEGASGRGGQGGEWWGCSGTWLAKEAGWVASARTVSPRPARDRALGQASSLETLEQ